MKKILNGRVYDTETATLIGKKDNGDSAASLWFSEIELYRKKTGEYFTYLSRCGGGIDASHPISPVSYDAAKEWAEKNLSADIFIAEFGKPDESNDEKQKLNLNLSAKSINKIKRLSQIQGKSVSQIIDDIIEKM